MTPRKRVEEALRGGLGASVPFTMYESKIPQCTVEREMRNRGLCIVKRDAPVFRTHRPNVTVSQQTFTQDGRRMVRTVHETPVGTVSTLDEPAGFTSWHHEKMFKGPEDYRTILFMIRDEVYEPCYEVFAQAQEAFGEDAIFRAGFGLEPLQALISGGMIGMQTFCVEWMDHRDEVLRLYDALVENRRKVYPIVAASPALHANYGGNVTPEIIGLEVFERYYVPHYQEAAEVMHRRGKLIGCHLDANCRLLSRAVAGTDLDYIEAFTPAPDTDMSLGDARRAWPDKVIWINFPSSVHLRPGEEIERTAVNLLNQAGSVEGILVGVTEDVPADRWQGNCRAVMDGLDRHARENSQLYRR